MRKFLKILYGVFIAVMAAVGIGGLGALIYCFVKFFGG